MKYANELHHHGVKGMKWGVRKDRKSSTKTGDAQERKTERNAKIKEKTVRAVVKGGEIAGKLMMANVMDDIFYDGAGKKIAKEAVIQTGRAAVTAYTMARGGYDIKWYDKQGRRVG